MFELRRATLDDAEIMLETMQIGFASFRAWAGPSFDPPPAALELSRIREGLRRPVQFIVRDVGDDGIPLTELDLSGLPSAEQDRRISELEATLPPKRAKTAATK